MFLSNSHISPVIPSWYNLFSIMSWLTVSNAFSASTVRSSKSRLIVLYIDIVSDAINAVNVLDACSVKPLCKEFCVGDSCFFLIAL